MRVGPFHLAYCTNIHRGENWQQTFDTLQRYTLAVRDRVSPNAPYAIGLRLSAQAARELSDKATLLEFQRWLGKNDCYVFTINGFPYGSFHGTRVKEQVYLPDWTSQERLDFTKLLFDLLGEIVPAGVEGSVSTVPASFKEFNRTDAEIRRMRDNLFNCIEHVAAVSEKAGRRLHLGLEPEPLCLLETTDETIEFIERIRRENGNDARLYECLGVNYDTCHLAIEFEEAKESLQKLQERNIKLSKVHLSSALKVRPTIEVQERLKPFVDQVYLHQVIARTATGRIERCPDLDRALSDRGGKNDTEWRIHFHIPLHAPKTELFDNTVDQLSGALDFLAANPGLCSHLEMETYTWEVMPDELKKRRVVDQLVGEYEWTLAQLRRRGCSKQVKD